MKHKTSGASEVGAFVVSAGFVWGGNEVRTVSRRDVLKTSLLVPAAAAIHGMDSVGSKLREQLHQVRVDNRSRICKSSGRLAVAKAVPK
jgi:hypothetical protein